MANNPNRDASFHEVPTYEYIFISGVAIHKRFFKYYTLTLCGFVGVSVAIACLTNWWLLLGITILQFVFIRGWMISLPAIGVTSVITYFWWKRRKNQHIRESLARDKKRDYEDAVIETNKRVTQNKKKMVN